MAPSTSGNRSSKNKQPRKQKKRTDDGPEPSASPDMPSGSTISSESDEPSKPVKKRRLCQKKPWSEAQKKAVLAFFRAKICLLQVPRMDECEECLAKNADILNGRTWRNIKDFVRNKIELNKKKMSR